MNVKNSSKSVSSDPTVKINHTLEELLERITDLEEKIRMLALTIDTVEDEKLEVENQLKKALADYHNLEKSIDNRITLKMVNVKKSVAESLITLMDDIYYGLKAKDNMTLTDDASAWVEGLSQTTSKMSHVLSVLGVEMIEVGIGDEMDSSKHEVITVIPGDEDNVIVEILQPGYRIDDIVIRPARVIVSKKS